MSKIIFYLPASMAILDRATSPLSRLLRATFVQIILPLKIAIACGTTSRRRAVLGITHETRECAESDMIAAIDQIK
ncbi:MAG TPA: hypothetical protein VN920_17245 [Pyrinomonadaceae bacterium]|nr:hypothetical protein [Pyrinomonadaceae bacterium]